jgi:hypothetical protein
MCPHEAGREAGHRLELADIFRTYGEAYRGSHALPRQHLRVMRAIEGLHKDSCKSGHRTQMVVLPHIRRTVLGG